MAFTYTWNSVIAIAKKNARNLTTTTVDAQYCDLVSSKMAQMASWRPLVTTIPPATILLQNGVQDYSVPANIYRLKKARITRTDTLPNPEVELDVRDDLASNLLPTDPQAIRVISHQMGEGMLRLEQAVQITTVGFALGVNSCTRTGGSILQVTTPQPHGYVQGETVVMAGITDATMDGTKQIQVILSPTSFTVQSVGVNGTSGGGSVTAYPYEIRGTIDINPTKVTITTQGCWFDDKYIDVAIEGLTYWYFLVGGDSRSGTTMTDSEGRVSYTGQLGVFYAKLWEMKKAETLQDEKALFPADPLSLGRNGSWDAIFWGN